MGPAAPSPALPSLPPPASGGPGPPAGRGGGGRGAASPPRRQPTCGARRRGERRRERSGGGAGRRPGGGPAGRPGVRRGREGRAVGRGAPPPPPAGGARGRGESWRSAGANARPETRGRGARARFRFCGVGEARLGSAGAILCCFVRRRRWLKSTYPTPAGSDRLSRVKALNSGERGSIYFKKRERRKKKKRKKSPNLYPVPFSCFLHLGGWLAAALVLTEVCNKQSHRPALPPSPPGRRSAPRRAPGRDPRPEALEETNPASRRRARPPCLWLSDPSWLPPAFLPPCSLCSSSLWLPCLYSAIAAL